MVSLLILFLLQIPRVESGPIPRIRASFPSETVPDSAIVKALQDYETFSGADWYFYNKVDLNDDREPEILVYVVGRWVCGSGGCPLFVLKKALTEYTVVTEILASGTPIVVSSERTNGWNDLILWQRSWAWDPKHKIGQPSYYAELRFDGQTYPSNPTVELARPLKKPRTGIAYLVDTDKPELGIRIKPGSKD